MSRAVIALGSNIKPEDNIRKAREALAQTFTVTAESAFKRTSPVGPVKQADFINGAVLIETDLSINRLKELLGQMELDLGRVKTAERSGPRSIDLDIVIYNDVLVDEDFHTRQYLKDSVLELIPDFEGKEDKPC